MSYRLVIAPEAYDELDQFIEYLAIDQQSPLIAQRWLEKALASLRTLKTFPHRCPPAPENAYYQGLIRMLIIDRGLFLYRVDEANQTVRILRFRHARQTTFHLED